VGKPKRARPPSKGRALVGPAHRSRARPASAVNSAEIGNSRFRLRLCPCHKLTGTRCRKRNEGPHRRGWPSANWPRSIEIHS